MRWQELARAQKSRLNSSRQRVKNWGVRPHQDARRWYPCATLSNHVPVRDAWVARAAWVASVLLPVSHVLCKSGSEEKMKLTRASVAALERPVDKNDHVEWD